MQTNGITAANDFRDHHSSAAQSPIGQSNPLAEWKEIFGQGSQPVNDARQYPAWDEVMAKFEDTRSRTLQLLDSMSDDDLDKSSHAPEEAKQFFGTIGACLSATLLQFTYHGGQVADARRAAGRSPLMG